jgi:hypothetical protein
MAGEALLILDGVVSISLGIAGERTAVAAVEDQHLLSGAAAVEPCEHPVRPHGRGVDRRQPGAAYPRPIYLTPDSWLLRRPRWSRTDRFGVGLRIVCIHVDHPTQGSGV